MSKFTIYRRGFDFDYFNERYEENFDDTAVEVLDDKEEALNRLFYYESSRSSIYMENREEYQSLSNDEKNEVIELLDEHGLRKNLTIENFYDETPNIDFFELPKDKYLNLLNKLGCSEYYLTDGLLSTLQNVLYVEEIGYINKTPHKYSETLFNCDNFEDLDEKLMDSDFCFDVNFSTISLTENDVN